MATETFGGSSPNEYVEPARPTRVRKESESKLARFFLVVAFVTGAGVLLALGGFATVTFQKYINDQVASKAAEALKVVYGETLRVNKNDVIMTAIWTNKDDASSTKQNTIVEDWKCERFRQSNLAARTHGNSAISTVDVSCDRIADLVNGSVPASTATAAPISTPGGTVGKAQ